jgi:FO synthase
MNLSDLENGSDVAAVLEIIDLASLLADAARLILGPAMSIQAPPNLHQPDDLASLLRAGVNDWGGMSPDHVNPEAPWPHLDLLEERTESTGHVLTQRLAIGPSCARDTAHWSDAAIAPRILPAVDAQGLPKIDSWAAGSDTESEEDHASGTLTAGRHRSLAAGHQVSGEFLTNR